MKPPAVGGASSATERPTLEAGPTMRISLCNTPTTRRAMAVTRGPIVPAGHPRTDNRHQPPRQRLENAPSRARSAQPGREQSRRTGRRSIRPAPAALRGDSECLVGDVTAPLVASASTICNATAVARQPSRGGRFAVARFEAGPLLRTRPPTPP